MSFLIYLIHTLVSLYSLVLVASTFLGMLLGPYHRLTIFMRRITEPVLTPIRRYIPPIRSGGMAWDLSPMVAILILWVIEQVLTRALLAFV
jgi:YggT family protein